MLSGLFSQLYCRNQKETTRIPERFNFRNREGHARRRMKVASKNERTEDGKTAGMQNAYAYERSAVCEAQLYVQPRLLSHLVT